MKPINAVFGAIAICLIVVPVISGGIIKGSIQGSPKKMVNAVVYIETVDQAFAPPVKHAVMDQKNLVFIPHVLPVLRGTAVDFLNSDNVRHNVFSPSEEKYNMGTWPSGEIKSRVFDKPGVYVQLCNVHAEMEGYIVVLQNPYFHLTEKDGKFEIKDVPPGSYVVKAWQEKLKKVQEQTVTVTENQETVITFTF
jgi:plastocyanin